MNWSKINRCIHDKKFIIYSFISHIKLLVTAKNAPVLHALDIFGANCAR